MKIAITADLHLGNIETCRERYNTLEQIIHQLEFEHIETLLIAGDLFDKDFHNHSEFEQRCKKHPKTHLYIIPGNHDASISEKSIVGSNIHIFSVPTIQRFDSVGFLFIPYQEQATIGKKIAEQIEEIGGRGWILIGHGDYYSGIKELNPLEPGTYMPLSKENVVTYKPQHVFLGHIHKPIRQNNVYYLGSPCGLDISETGKRRFMVYDTDTDNVLSVTISPDLLYFQESFVIVPVENEVALLKQEISKRIKSWGIETSDHKKVIVKVEACGYSLDRSAILQTLKEEFSKFTYYNDREPQIEYLSTSKDHQLNVIAERVVKLINDLDLEFSDDQPTKEMLIIEALNVIYGS